jgi:DnaK suppressor protein
MTVDLMQLRDKLLKRRQEIVENFTRLDSDWQNLLGKRDIELEEEAQKLAIINEYDQLEGRDKEEMEKIDLALNKLVLGVFGNCENCGKTIEENRLEALPSSRFCFRCARRFEEGQEQLPPIEEGITEAELPFDYQGMETEEILESIMEFLQNDGQVNLEELEARIEDNTLFLEGTIPSDAELQILMRILTEELGFRAIVDHLWISDLPWEREDRTPGIVPPPHAFAEGPLTETVEYSDDIFEAEEKELPYTPPEGPPPEKE